MSPSEANQHHPVLLRGVITFYNPPLYSRFVQDATAGIYLMEWTNAPMLTPGQLVEVEGTTSAGDFAPVVVPVRVTPVGEGKLPEPRKVSYDDLASGREDSQLVEVSGIVRSTRRDEPSHSLVLELATSGARLTAFAPIELTNQQDLVDSVVRARGVCTSEFNHQHQLVHIRLLIPTRSDLVVESRPPPAPFEIPAQKLESLLQFTTEPTYGRRAKAAGTVIYQQPGQLVFIQDGAQGLMVQTSLRTPLRRGDRIEALGFPTPGDYSPVLQDAIYRVTGHGAEPEPAVVSVDEALQGPYHCRLVRMHARLVDRAGSGREAFLELANGQTLFHAYRDPDERADAFERFQNGSELLVTGICLIDPGGQWYSGGWRAKDFRLLLRSASDVVVLSTPSWWTLRRLFWTVAVLGVLILGALAWVAVLRRRVRGQTELIRQKLELEAALKERYQNLFENANDIVYTHDLNGNLTSINQAGEDLLQLRREQILARNLSDLIVPEQRPGVRQWLAQAAQGAAPPTVEWDFANAFGQRLKLEISTRLISRNGHPAEVEGIARDITERKRLEQEILEISNREQRRIGHDLHDGVCQQLAGINYLTETLAERLEERGAPEAVEADRISRLIATATAQARGVARGLSPVRLQEHGLASALEEMAANAASLFQIPCRFTCSAPPEDIPSSAAVHLFYIAREAVANAAKHSGASGIEVTLESSPDLHTLTVRDSGTGFSPTSGSATGMGLRIMQYRARVIGAHLELKSRPSSGTEVRCCFPRIRDQR